MNSSEFFNLIAAIIGGKKQGGTAMIQRENITITAIDVFRGFILGLMGVFFGFLVFLMLL